MESSIEAIARELHAVWLESLGCLTPVPVWNGQSEIYRQAWKHLAAHEFSIREQLKHEKKA